jgi:hypothetical protein
VRGRGDQERFPLFLPKCRGLGSTFPWRKGCWLEGAMRLSPPGGALSR